MNIFIISFIGTIVLFFILKKIQLHFEKISKNENNKKIESPKNVQNTNNFILEEYKKESQKQYLNFTQKEMLRTYYLKYSNITNRQVTESNITNRQVTESKKYNTKVIKPLKNVIKKGIVGNHKVLTGKKTIKSSFIVIDIETTGLHSIRDEIIEIGAIKIENINSTQHKTFQAFIKPKKAIPEFITNINGITNEMVENADSIEEVLEEFLDFIEDYPLVGHNIDFDIKFLNNKIKKAKLDFNNKELIDTLPLSRRAFPKSYNHKLQTLVRYIGINTNGSHRALEDSKATLFVYTTSLRILYNQ
ncbi:3'-5' exonuclease [Aliarcobacter butzleri]|uniref:3'-5' exonuclease n=1 Tax=Aliarcobacter butzleri TaxID=28197 RepID=UPI000F487C40|nr:3'-5' exonuclease [Aliarcobacter butzleri]MDK2050936.1 3'-5' exonuclease [Aliarcobacter butzleri]